MVVENDDTPQYSDLIKHFKDRVALTYVVEPVAGLTHARNRVLTTALELEVDWIGCVDDDVRISSDWLIHMAKAINTYPDAQFFFGNWARTKAKNAPSWYPHSTSLEPRPTGSKVRLAAGGNNAIHASVFSPDGMALKYDHQFRFTGGEDTDFSIQFANKGGIMRSVFEAVGTEEVHEERSDFSVRMARHSDAQYATTKIRHKHKSPPLAVLWSLQTVYRSTILGIVNIVAGGLALPVNKNWGLTRYGIGRGFLAGVPGVFRYYFGKDHEPYRHVDGD